jgi:hypothetical protein
MALRVGFFFAALGVVLIGIGVMEMVRNRGASATPEEITLKQLIARGTEGNPNVAIRDFRLGDNFVYETKGTSTRWNKVCIPIVPADEAPRGPGPFRPTNVRAILMSFNAHNEGEVAALRGRTRLEALVNRIGSLDKEEKKLLEQSYPGTDFSQCIILLEGRKPFSGVVIGGMLGGGALMLLVGGGILGYAFVQWRSESATRPPKKKKKRPADEVDEREEVDDEDEEPRPRKRRLVIEDEDEEPRPKKRRPIVDDDEDDEPRPRKRRRLDDDY